MRLGIHHCNVAWSGVKRRYVFFLNKIPNNRLDNLKLIICCPIITHWIINWSTLMIMSLQICFWQPKCIMRISQLQFYPLFCRFHRERCGDIFWSTQIVHIHKNKLYMKKKIWISISQSSYLTLIHMYLKHWCLIQLTFFVVCYLFIIFDWPSYVNLYTYVHRLAINTC